MSIYIASYWREFKTDSILAYDIAVTHLIICVTNLNSLIVAGYFKAEVCNVKMHSPIIA